MNLQQFFGRLFLKINNKKENLPLLNPTADEFIRITKSTNKSGSEYSLLKSNNNLNTAKKLNAALQGIDKALKEEGHKAASYYKNQTYSYEKRNTNKHANYSTAFTKTKAIRNLPKELMSY